jgi:hypothetical protein
VLGCFTFHVIVTERTRNADQLADRQVNLRTGAQNTGEDQFCTVKPTVNAASFTIGFGYRAQRAAFDPELRRGRSLGQVRTLVESSIEGRVLGLIGEPRVNVLRLNLALDQLKS